MTTPGSTIIRDVKIKGTLEFKESLFLDCQFEGKILSEGDLTIGENGSVDGEIKAAEINIYGNVNGNINVTGTCRIKESATLIGDVTAKRFQVTEGAIFHGYAAVPFHSSEETVIAELDQEAGKKEPEGKTKEPTNEKGSPFPVKDQTEAPDKDAKQKSSAMKSNEETQKNASLEIDHALNDTATKSSKA